MKPTNKVQYTDKTEPPIWRTYDSSSSLKSAMVTFRLCKKNFQGLKWRILKEEIVK